eukprot:4772008-Karenia_brevis.AAC.1
MTRHLTREVIDRDLQKLNCRDAVGRSVIAPNTVAAVGEMLGRRSSASRKPLVRGGVLDSE